MFFKLGEEMCTNARTSEGNGRSSNEMLIFQKDIRKDDLGISKVMHVSLLNLNDKDLRSKTSTKKMVGVLLLLPTFLPSET